MIKLTYSATVALWRPIYTRMQSLKVRLGSKIPFVNECTFCLGTYPFRRIDKDCSNTWNEMTWMYSWIGITLRWNHLMRETKVRRFEHYHKYLLFALIVMNRLTEKNGETVPLSWVQKRSYHSARHGRETETALWRLDNKIVSDRSLVARRGPRRRL